jgi:hypothetical protein
MRYWYQNLITKWLQPEYKLLYVADPPEIVLNYTIYIIGHKEYPWLIVFKCPCGCGALVQLNLLKEATPCWSFEVSKKGKIDILPSVWRKQSCRSHFFVRKSKIYWVRSVSYPLWVV